MHLIILLAKKFTLGGDGRIDNFVQGTTTN